MNCGSIPIFGENHVEINLYPNLSRDRLDRKSERCPARGRAHNSTIQRQANCPNLGSRRCPESAPVVLDHPLILLTGVTLVMTAAYELQFSSLVNKLWVSTFPFLAEPAGFSMVSLVNTPEGKARMGRRVGVSNSVHCLCRVQHRFG